MNIHLVAFASGNCVKGQTKIVNSALENGFKQENIHIFGAHDVFDDPFVIENHHIFKEKKGAGYWAWKPFIILKVMQNIPMGDVIVYHDSGRPCYDWKFTKCMKPFVEYVCEHHGGVGITFGPFKHGNWTKHDCFEVMGCDEHKFRNHNQASATWGVWQKNVLSVSILNEWLRWMMTPSRIVTDDKSIIANEREHFKHHRHDQSILTNIILRLHFEGKYNNLIRSKGVYEKNINKVSDKNMTK